MPFRAIGSKASASAFRVIGGKVHSDMHRTHGAKHVNHSRSSIMTVPYASGLGGMSDGSFMAGNAHSALANGQTDKRPIPSFRNADQAAGNMLERQTKRQKGGL